MLADLAEHTLQLDPSLVVVGGSDTQAVRTVAEIYAPLDVDPCLVSLRTAEMIKYCCNAFHALKIAFANEVGALAGKWTYRPGCDGRRAIAAWTPGREKAAAPVRGGPTSGRPLRVPARRVA
jgi:hypothetical protein